MPPRRMEPSLSKASSGATRLLWATSISSIDPIPTVSQGVSPAPLSGRHPLSTMLESPRRVDILASNISWEATDQSQQDSAKGGLGETPRPTTGVPITSQFCLEANVRQKTAISMSLPRPPAKNVFQSAGSFGSVCITVGGLTSQ